MKVKGKNKIQNEFPAYPLYLAEEDVYNKNLIKEDINPKDIKKTKLIDTILKRATFGDESYEVANLLNEMDVSGADLGDEQEKIGEQNEENNY